MDPRMFSESKCDKPPSFYSSMLWKISKNSKVSYLYGTIHHTGIGDAQLSSEAKNAIENSDCLVLERKLDVEEETKETKVLSDILKKLSPSETPDWQHLITLIEGYHMNDNIKDKLKKQFGDQLTEAQFEELLFLYEQYPEENRLWEEYVDKINNNAMGSPDGPNGVKLINFIYDWENKIKENKEVIERRIRLGLSMQESIKSEKITQLPLTPEASHWLYRASIAYWLNRWDHLTDKVFNNINSDPEGPLGKEIVKEWNTIVNDYSQGNTSFTLGVLCWHNLMREWMQYFLQASI